MPVSTGAYKLIIFRMPFGKCFRGIYRYVIFVAYLWPYFSLSMLRNSTEKTMEWTSNHIWFHALFNMQGNIGN